MPIYDHNGKLISKGSQEKNVSNQKTKPKPRWDSRPTYDDRREFHESAPVETARLGYHPNLQTSHEPHKFQQEVRYRAAYRYAAKKQIQGRKSARERGLTEEVVVADSVATSENPDDKDRAALDLSEEVEPTNQAEDEEQKEDLSIVAAVEPLQSISASGISNDDFETGFESDDDDDKTFVDETVNSEEKEEEQSSASVEEEKQKAPIKMRYAVADFAKKVKDNEGMGISTFTFLEDEGEDPEKSEPKMEFLAHKDDWAKLLELDPKIVEQYKAQNAGLSPRDKLKRSIRTVIIIIIACRTKTEQTRKANSKYMTFQDMQEDGKVEDTSEVSLRFSFKRDHYKAQQEQTLRQDAVEALTFNPINRTEEMIQAALKAIRSVVEVFSEFPINMQRSLIERGWFEKFESKRVIIRQGHKALNFYFIISGVTVVSVARQNKVTGESYGETVAFLKKGNSFGELALMYGGKRSATVSCTTSVELLAVAREDFIDIFMNLSAESEPEHISFLREIPLLRMFPFDRLPYDDPSICLFTYFRRGTVLCRDSNFSEWVYIIRTGHCRIIKEVDFHCKTREDLMHPNRVTPTKFYKFMTNQSLFGSLEKEREKLDTGHQRKGDSKNKGRVYIMLKILGPKSVFGLEPIAFDIMGGTNGVTLVSDGAECVAIKKDFFKDYVTESYGRTLRKELQPFPTQEDLEIKLNDNFEWDAYRSLVLDDVIRCNNSIYETVHV